MLRFASGAAALTLLVAASSAGALAVEIEGHTPPKITKQGTTSKATVPGSVTVQVLVNANGSFTVKRVLKSTNHADDAAALEIAKTATYKPAINNGKPDTEFYDFTMKFTSSGLAAAPAGTLPSYEAMIHAGQYDAAKSGLTSYLAAHPGDAKASLDLALTETFMNDTPDAAALFAKAGDIPDSMKAAARKALYETANADVAAKKFDEGLLYAKKAVAVVPDYVSYSILGLTSMGSGDPAGAVTAYEKSLSLASGATAKERATLNINLVTAYLGVKDPDKAKAAADAAKALDPTVNVGGAFGSYYQDLANKSSAAGDYPGAASQFEAGAAQDPTDAVTLYTDAAFQYLRMKTPDYVKGKADADKALAIDSTDAGANFAEGVILANTGHSADAIATLTKADSSAKAKGNTSLATQIETNLKNLNATK